FVDPALIPPIDTHEEAGHRIATCAAGSAVRSLTQAVVRVGSSSGSEAIKPKLATGPSRLREINSVHAAFATELEFMIAMHPIDGTTELVGLLAFTDNAEGLSSDVISSHIPILVERNRWKLLKAGRVHVSGETQISYRIEIGEITSDTGFINRAASDAISHIQHESRAEGLGVVHGKQVVVFLNWAAGAWISLIAETIKTVIAGSVFGILAAQQFAFT